MVDGKKIKARREEKNMTMDELSRLIEVNKSTIQRYEKGEIASMPYLTFFKLLIALETTPEYILPPEEYELIEKTDELRGFYYDLSQVQKAIVTGLKNLPPEKNDLIAALVRELQERHRE